MCPEHSMYCYPSGCMKTNDMRKKYSNAPIVLPPTRTEFNDTVKSSYLVDNGEEQTKNNYIDDFLDGNLGIKKAIGEDDVIKNEMFKTNPLKDRYKMVFKYKRIPKVEMRYNLREQVKNVKTDKQKHENYDMSNQRWPKGKHWIHSRQLVESIPPLKIDENRAKKYYMFTENDPTKYTSPKYFKRDASKFTNEEAINVETLYIYQTDTDSPNMSVESVIDNLIESSFEGLTNLVSMEANNTLNQSVDEKTSTDSSFYRAKNAVFKNGTYVNTTEFRDSLKFYFTTTSPPLDETTIQNDNVDDPNIILQSKANFLDVIAKMSNKIEQQNNASIEIINRMTGHNNLKHFTPRLRYIEEKNKQNVSKVTKDIKKSTETPSVKRDITILALNSSLEEKGKKNNSDNV
ncbi:PREDICTED: uncharacterized protein LOC106111103 [Papilio polytes]|uniref:uncharacterized protein LOC106111103 n=1 Tax=Papilio polytes TaxID=76194 RepID=UPI0006760462|nr:PREDICTED: uncharacterized protein LOC106111103 [Papilio polytes]